MSTRLVLLLAPSLVAVALVACKDKGSEADASVPLPTPGATTAAPPAEPPPATTAATVTAPAHPVVAHDAGAPDAAPAASALADAGKPPTDAGAAAPNTLKACFDKCQAAMQGCVAPQPGKLGNPAACTAAAAACQAACKP